VPFTLGWVVVVFPPATLVAGQWVAQSAETLAARIQALARPAETTVRQRLVVIRSSLVVARRLVAICVVPPVDDGNFEARAV
jgi:hypothetical protein